jgi:hypothetical protein
MRTLRIRERIGMRAGMSFLNKNFLLRKVVLSKGGKICWNFTVKDAGAEGTGVQGQLRKYCKEQYRAFLSG